MTGFSSLFNTTWNSLNQPSVKNSIPSRHFNKPQDLCRLNKLCDLTKTRQVSTNEKVPERPIPALQCTTGGPCSDPKDPDSRTLNRKLRKEAGDSGTPKSGHEV